MCRHKRGIIVSLPGPSYRVVKGKVIPASTNDETDWLAACNDCGAELDTDEALEAMQHVNDYLGSGGVNGEE